MLTVPSESSNCTDWTWVEWKSSLAPGSFICSPFWSWSSQESSSDWKLALPPRAPWKSPLPSASWQGAALPSGLVAAAPPPAAGQASRSLVGCPELLHSVVVGVGDVSATLWIEG